MTGIQIQLFRRGLVLLAGALITLVGCDSPRPIEATSLLGAPLVRPVLEPEKSARLEADLSEARALAAAEPDSQDAAIWVGRRVGYLARYHDAIAQYTSAIGHFGETAKLLRHRGHRYITLRQIDRAIVDLTQAKFFADALPEEIEPDGIPSQGGPRTTLQGNIDYHLALALFLEGEVAGGGVSLDSAASAWKRAVDRCNNDDTSVAARYWLAVTEFERGDAPAARRALDPVVAKMDILENRTYHQLCLALKGEIPAASLTARDGPLGIGVDRATLGFGLAMHARHVALDEGLAMRRLVENSQLPEWASFGVIASEAVLKRGGK